MPYEPTGRPRGRPKKNPLPQPDTTEDSMSEEHLTTAAPAGNGAAHSPVQSALETLDDDLNSSTAMLFDIDALCDDEAIVVTAEPDKVVVGRPRSQDWFRVFPGMRR